MTEKEIIQAWKTNEKPFGLVCKEMQEKLIDITAIDGPSCALFFCRVSGCYYWNECDSNDFNHAMTYRLRPDYPEPSGFVECKVFKDDDNELCCCINDTRYSLHEVIQRDTFIGYKYEDGEVTGETVRYKDKKTGITYPIVDLRDIADHEILRPIAVVFKEVR